MVGKNITSAGFGFRPPTDAEESAHGFLLGRILNFDLPVYAADGFVLQRFLQRMPPQDLLFRILVDGKIR